MHELPALGGLGLTAAVLVALIGIEAARNREMRQSVRHDDTDPVDTAEPAH